MKKVKFIVGIEGLGFLSEVFDVEGLEPSNPNSEDLSSKYEADMYSWGDPKIFWDVQEAKEDEPVGITVYPAPPWISSWIPVCREQKPKPNEDILFVTTKGDIWKGYYVDDLWGWEAYGVVFPFRSNEVTHWRLLPEGPKSELKD